MKKLVSFFLIIGSAVFLLSCKPKVEATIPASSQQQSAPVVQNDDSVFTKEFLFDQASAVKDTGSVTFNNVSGMELTAAMKTGWNMGNTLDATGTSGMASETSWGQPLTTKAMIDGLAASGIKTIRIPVSWNNHITDRRSYTIHPDWMARVKEVVDWAIENDMYVILNIHHDNYEKNAKMPKFAGFYPTDENYEESAKFVCNTWAQIALACNEGYDEHLGFEV